MRKRISEGDWQMGTRAFLVGAVLASGILVSGCVDNKTANVATGAVIGGVIGNQFGNGTGNTVATVAGAAAGASIAANRTP